MKYSVLSIAFAARLLPSAHLSVAALFSVAVSVAAATHATPALSAPLVVGKFSGSKPQGMRAAVVDALKDAGYEVVPEADSPEVSSKADEAEFATIALDDGYRGFVYGNTALGMGSWTVTLEVRSGASGEVVGKRTLKAKSYNGLRSAIAEKLGEVLKGSLERAEAPASVKEEEKQPAPTKAADELDEPGEDEPAGPPEQLEETEEPAEEAVEEDAEPKDEPSSKGRLPALSVYAGPRFVMRDWSLSDSLIGGSDGPISPTHSAPMLGVGGQITIYPGSFIGPGALEYIGVELRAARTFVGDTDVPGDDEPRKTTFKEFSGALRGRVPLGSALVGVFVGYGRNDLILAGEKVIATQPDVKYAFVQAGADGAFALAEHVGLDVRAEYRHVLGFGDLRNRDLQGERWFPNTEGRGFALGAGVGYTFTESLGVRLGGNFTNYVMSFNQKVADLEAIADAGQPAPPIAGGASDLYYGADLSLTYTLVP